MTFNIQHGIDGAGRYDLRRAVDTIARIQPDIVGLQEVTRNHPSYHCDDQPALIASALTAQTGTLWNVVYQQEWFTAEMKCPNSGRGDGPATEGLVWLTKRSMSTPSMVALIDGRIGLNVSLRDARDVPLVVTHLSSGSARASIRSQQVDRLLSWTAGLGQPRIVIGDFNLTPNEPEMQRVMSVYHDAWTEAVRAGRASGNGATKGGSRVDYVLFAGERLTVDSIEVVNTVALIGVQASDHWPVVATFTLR